MIITFCGHRDFQSNADMMQKLVLELLSRAEQTDALLCYSGGYGGFDRFAAYCVKQVQKEAANIRNCLVIPYLTVVLQKETKEYGNYFDEVIYPPLENVPPRYAIIRRNEWMIDRADLLIAYVTHGWGGAAKTIRYAKRKGIEILNMSESFYSP